MKATRWSMGTSKFPRARCTFSFAFILFLSTLLFSTAIHAQQVRPISGHVISGTGQPLSGASVRVKGTNVGTSTDSSGAFTVNVGPTATLVISYVGYASQEVT